MKLCGADPVLLSVAVVIVPNEFCACGRSGVSGFGGGGGELLPGEVFGLLLSMGFSCDCAEYWKTWTTICCSAAKSAAVFCTLVIDGDWPMPAGLTSVTSPA